ncbi:MAG: hypothetical protein O2921_11335 [Chloroflexi bacterium]|nr:hypothetical protein [Chloroflexota bacterium]MDA1283186.1 hypothetical protein [Chloroflexota bacterium]
MPDQTPDEHNSSRNPDQTSNQDQDERVLFSTAPDADQLDDIQESIEELVESGEAQQALSELQLLRDPDKAEVLADLQPENRRALLGSLSVEEIADVLEHMDVD